MRTSQFFHGSARGPGPEPISDEQCKIHILEWPPLSIFFFSDSLNTYWDFESVVLVEHKLASPIIRRYKLATPRKAFFCQHLSREY